MKDLEKYLDKDEKELLSLIFYHRRQYENTKIRQGGLHPDDIQIMELLDKGETMLKSISLERKNREEIKQKPIRTNCPKCNIEKERNPIGEEKSEHGYMCNNYHCDECKIDYMDFKPNNAKDQLSWFEEFMAVLEKHKEDMTKMPNEFTQSVIELKKQGEIFKKACEEEEEALINLQQAEQKQSKAIAQYRDYLLIAKVKRQWGDSPTDIN
ncbi:MAG: hypothetical protein V1781_01640 [Bacteroidota bacterium]